MAGTYTFGACLACRCLQSRKSRKDGDDQLDDYDLHSTVGDIHTQFSRNSQVGAEKFFLTDRMDSSHMIQQAYAWLAVHQWLRMSDPDLRDATDDDADFTNTVDEMAGKAFPHTSTWDKPPALDFADLFEWIGNLPGGRAMRTKSNYLGTNHEYMTCAECNLLMDVKGRIWSLLWNIQEGTQVLNQNDDDTTALIPVRAITITMTDGTTKRIPRKKQANEQNLDRQKLYTPVLSYFVHRCLVGLTDHFQTLNKRVDAVHFRVCVMVCVCALKLLCWQKESIVRWSDTAAEQRSRHNYEGVVRLFISYVMYMMYLCDAGEDFRKISFQSFHLFYMNELDSSPVWDKNQHKDLWNFVLRASELDDSGSATVEQLNCILSNLVELYKTYVSHILVVMHPSDPVTPDAPSAYALRLTAAQLAIVQTDLMNFFVNSEEVTRLQKLHDQANTNKKSFNFPLYIKKIGFAPTGIGIRKLFSGDGPDCVKIIDQWLAVFLQKEYERMKTQNALRSIDAARALYLMCNICRDRLETEGIVDPGQQLVEVLGTPSEVKDCLDKLDSLPFISVWKAALRLLPYGNCTYVPARRNAELPKANAKGFVEQLSQMGVEISLPCGGFNLSQCFSMRTGRQLGGDR